MAINCRLIILYNKLFNYEEPSGKLLRIGFVLLRSC